MLRANNKVCWLNVAQCDRNLLESIQELDAPIMVSNLLASCLPPHKSEFAFVSSTEVVAQRHQGCLINSFFGTSPHLHNA